MLPGCRSSAWLSGFITADWLSCAVAADYLKFLAAGGPKWGLLEVVQEGVPNGPRSLFQTVVHPSLRHFLRQNTSIKYQQYQA